MGAMSRKRTEIVSPERDEVQRLLDTRAIVVARYPDHGLGSAAGDSAKHGRQLFIAHGPVLGVHQQPVIAAVRELFGNRMPRPSS